MIDERGTETNPGAQRGHGPFSPKRRLKAVIISSDENGAYQVQYADGTQSTRQRRELVESSLDQE